MGENGIKRLMVMIMLLVTLFLVLKHAEDCLLPLSTPHILPSFNSLPLHARLLSFSPDDGSIRISKRNQQRMEKLKKCNADCVEDFIKNFELYRFDRAKDLFKDCRESCKKAYGIC